MSLIPSQKEAETEKLQALIETALNMNHLSGRELASLSKESSQILLCFLTKKFGIRESTMN